jgi:hypothetical protein
MSEPLQFELRKHLNKISSELRTARENSQLISKKLRNTRRGSEFNRKPFSDNME